MYSRATGGDELGDRKRVNQGDNILDVQIRLSIVGVRGRLGQRSRAILRVDEDDGEAMTTA